MRRLFLTWVVTASAWSSAPSWWVGFLAHPALESRFRQESESLVFGKLSRQGSLVLASGGRLRVVYETGLTVVCDGRHLVQYDPDTRTAQRVELARAVRDFPLLGLLLDPAGLERLYRMDVSGDVVRLLPKEAGLPAVRVTGRQGRLRGITWTDPSGANQSLELLAPKTPSARPSGVFTFLPPAGTRWSTPNG